MKIRIALVGFGKIARDEHLPAIRAHEGYELAAIVSPESIPEVGCPSFNNFEDMISSMPGEIDAAAICTPPTPRYQIAMQAMANGLAVLLEKPPTATLKFYKSIPIHACVLVRASLAINKGFSAQI